MRGSKILASALLILLTANPSGSFAANQQTSVFEARYAAMKVAMAARDGKAILMLLAPNFSSIDVSGQMESGGQMVGEVAQLPKDPKKVSHTTILSAKVVGTTATINQRYDMKTVKTNPDGTTKNVELVTLSTDTWVKSGDTWLLEKTVTEQMDYFVNGQPVMHKVATP